MTVRQAQGQAEPRPGVTLGILYHMPFWRASDGTLWEAEGSFARYVDSLAPYFNEIVLAVPVFDAPQSGGSRVRASNVRLAALPYFAGPRQFYPMLPRVLGRLRRWVQRCDVVHLRVPSPAAIFAFRQAQRLRKPTFLLVVGDYRALLPHLPYRGWKRRAFSAYVDFEEWALRHMVSHALTFTNGAALRAKHQHDGPRVHETRTTTLTLADLASRADTCLGRPVRLLTVSRIDPRKGLAVLPGVVASLVAHGHDVTLDIVGPTVGRLGEQERDSIDAAVVREGVAGRVTLAGAIPLDRLLALYAQFDLFVLATRPGEGVPRVLMEAMAGGLPVVATDVAGIGSLIQDGDNGLLVGSDAAPDIAAAIARIIESPDLRQRLISRGYQTVRDHTLERQAERMMKVVASELRLPIEARSAA